MPRSIRRDRCRQSGHEFLQFLTVPALAAPGTHLLTLRVNPTHFPRLTTLSSQFKQWKGPIRLHIESLGNALTFSSVTAAFFPDPENSQIPTAPATLLSTIEACPRKTTLHLQSTQRKTVHADWSLSTNPWKFIADTDPSDQSNGFFVIVANGSPGSEPVQLKISASYDVTFQGSTFAAI